MSISSTSPTLPTDSKVSAVSITFNRNVTEEELVAAQAKLKVSTVSSSSIPISLTLSSGKLYDNSEIGQEPTQAGTYTISNKVVSISLSSQYYVQDFVIN